MKRALLFLCVRNRLPTAGVLSLLLSTVASMHAVDGVANLIEPARPHVTQIVSEYGLIPPDRATILREASAFINDRVKEAKPAPLIFICTHNSRRSHLAQVWAQAAAAYYNVTNVVSFSGGTETAACNIRTIRALQRAGVSIVNSTGGTNPVYLAQWSESLPPAKLYSKTFSDTANPQIGFAAFLCCDQADAKCPIVQGAAARFSIPYVDPKASDNTDKESATYDERCRQIAREMFCLVSLVKAGS